MHSKSFFAILAVIFPVLAAPLQAASDLKAVSYVPFVKDENNRTTVLRAANGLYMSYNNTHLAYYGIPEQKEGFLTKRYSAGGEELASRQLTCDVSCINEFSSASDIQGAENGLSNHFATNPNFSGSVSYVFGNVWAFGCDYGNGQNVPVSQYNFDVGCTDAQCGTSQAGWNSHHSWNSTYGREFGVFGC